MPNKKSTEVLVGALGPQKTFSDLACDWYIQKELKHKARKKLYSSIWEVFNALKKGKIDKAVVPIENNIYGTVRETFDSLFKSAFSIILQFSLPVHHCLAVKKGTKKSKIDKIISHQQALNQCRAYLRKNYPEAQRISFQSSVAAIKKVISARNLHRAVICSVKAAKDYDLKILDQNIEDQKKNRTLFAVLSKEPKIDVKGKNMRTSIAFHFQKDSPGTLFSVFKEFNDAKINMTKIESRPTLPKWGDYIFFLDFEGSLNDSNVKKILKKVKTKVALLKVFGSYPLKKV